jgi:hypothetical protein
MNWSLSCPHWHLQTLDVVSAMPLTTSGGQQKKSSLLSSFINRFFAN